LKTDYKVYLEPSPPALPAAGGTFTDPTFGTTIMRVTDSSDGPFNVTNYSYWPSFNRDSSRLYIIAGGDATLYQFDAANFRISNKRKLFLSNSPSGGLVYEDATWSGTDPNVIYGHAGLRVYAYNVVSNTYTLVKDFGPDLGGGSISQMSKSVDDNVFGFTTRSSGGGVTGYIAWTRSTNSLYRVQTTSLDEVQVDKTGQYLVVKTADSGANQVRVKVVNLVTRAVENLIDGPPDYAPGHSDNGRGFVIGGDNWKNRFVYRNLATPHQFYSVVDFGEDWSVGSHLSMLADDDRWLLVSTFKSNDLPSQKLFRNELFLVATDGSKKVRRLAHIHSVWREYWDTPRANVSRDGRFAVFTSNWGSTSRRDVFVVKIPPAESDEYAKSNVNTRTAPVSPAPSAPVPVKPAEVIKAGAREGVAWTGLVNCTALGGVLRKTGGEAAEAGAHSRQAIASGDGYLEFTAAESNKVLYCGLARDASGPGFTAIDFAIKLTANGVAEVREGNDYAGEINYRGGDVFRIAVEGGAVKYYKNGALFFTSLRSPAYPLYAAASLVTINGAISNAVISSHARSAF
jgi:hypothetical protein